MSTNFIFLSVVVVRDSICQATILVYVMIIRLDNEAKKNSGKL